MSGRGRHAWLTLGRQDGPSVMPMTTTAPASNVPRACIAIISFALSAHTLHAQRASDFYQRAVILERASGKLDSAIRLYERAVKEAGADRALAARALVGLGGAYELLGRTEARAAYERVLRDFGDQRDLVAQARARVAALDRTARTGSGGSVAASAARRLLEGTASGPPAAPSPDGRQFAYFDWASGNVTVLDIASGSKRVLTRNAHPEGPGREWVDYVAFSPDGREVAFVWSKDNSSELRIAPAQGGATRTIHRGSMGLYAWSGARQRLLVVVGEKSTLSWMDPRDGSLTGIRDLETWPENASVSPDGQWIVLDQLTRKQPLSSYQLHIVAADGSRFGSLLERPAGDWRPFWTPDGKGVAFLSDRSGARGLWLLEVRDGVARGEPVLIKGDMDSNVPLGFSRAGSLFYHSAAMFDVQIATLDPRTGTASQQPRFASTLLVGSHSTPDWSPSGRSLATTLMRGSRSGAQFSRVIELLDVSSGFRNVLMPNLAQLFLPRWSPDGKSLLVWGVPAEGGGQAGHFIVDSASGRMTTVYSGPNHHGIGVASWSADGRSVFYVRQDSVSDDIWRFDRADSSRHLVFRDRSLKWVREVSASPDGRSLLLISPGTVAKVLNLADGRARDLPAPGPEGSVVTGNWTPDGALVGAVRTSNPKIFEMWRVPVDGSPARKLEFTAPSLSSARTSRDGRQVAFMAELTSAGLGVWVVDGLIPAATPAARRH